MAEDASFGLWLSLRGKVDKLCTDPLLKFCKEVQAEVADRGSSGDEDMIKLLEARLRRLAQEERAERDKIAVKQHALDRLQAEVLKFQSTLQHMRSAFEWVQVNRALTEACLQELTKRKSSELRGALGSLCGPSCADGDGSPTGAAAADAVAAVVSSVREESSQAAKVEAAFWHLRRLGELQDATFFRDFERYCASVAEQPFPPESYETWSHCASELLAGTRVRAVLPGTRTLLLRCATEILKRWSRQQREQPPVRDSPMDSNPLHLRLSPHFETIAGLLQSVNDEVKAAAAGLIAAVAQSLGDERQYRSLWTAGCVQQLMKILQSGSSAAPVLESALTSLREMSAVPCEAGSESVRDSLRVQGAVAACAALLAHDSELVIENAALLLESLTVQESCQRCMQTGTHLERLVNTLYHPSGRVQCAAARALRNCAKDETNRSLIRQLGGVGTLIDLLRSGDLSVQDSAVWALWNLTICDEVRKLMRECDGLEPLVHLLSSPFESIVENAGGALWNCASIGDNRVAIRKIGGLRPLLRLLKHENTRIQKNAAGAIRNCAINDQNKIELRILGGLNLLCDLLETSQTSVLDMVTSTLWICSINSENKDVVREAGGFPRLLRLLRNENASIREKALGILRNCSTLAENRAALAACSATQHLVELLSLPSDQLTNGMKEYAAATLWNLARDDKVSPQRHGVLECLVALLRDAADSVVENAAGGVLSLTLRSENRDHLRRVGGVEALVSCLSSSNAFVLEHAAASLKNATQGNEANQRLLGDIGGAELLLPLLQSATDHVVREAALVLKNIAAVPELSEAIGCSGAIPELVRLVEQSESSSVRKAAGHALAALSRSPHNRRQFPAAFRKP